MTTTNEENSVSEQPVNNIEEPKKKRVYKKKIKDEKDEKKEDKEKIKKTAHTYCRLAGVRKSVSEFKKTNYFERVEILQKIKIDAIENLKRNQDRLVESHKNLLKRIDEFIEIDRKENSEFIIEKLKMENEDLKKKLQEKQSEAN